MSDETKTNSLQELIEQDRNQRITECAKEIEKVLNTWDCSLVSVVRFAENGPATSWEIISKR